MRAVRLVIVLALLGACDPAGTQFKATVVQPDGSFPMPAVLWDQTGLVTGIESVTAEFGDGDRPAVQRDAQDPNALLVSWGTGACDHDTRLVLQPSGTTYRLDIAVNSGLNLSGCTAQLLLRGLRIHLSRPVSVDSIAAFGGD